MRDVKREVRILLLLQLSKAIPHEPKPIRTPILDLKILRSQLLYHLPIQQRRPGPRRRHTAILPMVLVPTTTAPAPRQRLVDLVAVADKLVSGTLFRDDRPDVFAADLAQPLDDVVGGPGHAGDESAVADGGVGTGEDEVVREVGTGEG